MKPAKPQLDPLRLCDAAEAVLIAVVDAAERMGGRWPDPVQLVGTPLCPESLKPYSRDEVEQATEFLVRLGFLEVGR